MGVCYEGRDCGYGGKGRRQSFPFEGDSEPFDARCRDIHLASFASLNEVQDPAICASKPIYTHLIRNMYILPPDIHSSRKLVFQRQPSHNIHTQKLLYQQLSRIGNRHLRHPFRLLAALAVPLIPHQPACLADIYLMRIAG